MGSKKTRKKLSYLHPVTALTQAGDKLTGDKGKQTVEQVTGKLDVRQARQTAALQEQEIKRQTQLERLKLAESEDEKKRRMYLSKYGGRRSLIATSMSGETDRLGG